jgi:hypothetical protein
LDNGQRKLNSDRKFFRNSGVRSTLSDSILPQL